MIDNAAWLKVLNENPGIRKSHVNSRTYCMEDWWVAMSPTLGMIVANPNVPPGQIWFEPIPIEEKDQ